MSGAPDKGGWRVYLAGPMRGLPDFNFPAFHEAATDLRRVGFEVFNPAERDTAAGFDPSGMTGLEDLSAMGFSLREALAADTEYISKHADVVMLLPDWERSSGVAAEIALARALGLPVLLAEDAILAVFNADRDTLAHAWFEDRDIRHATAASADLRQVVNVATALGVSPSTALGYGEVRTTSSTGGQKGMKPERFDLIPIGPLTALARHYGAGALKYDDHQWRKGYEWSKSFAALMRHLTAWWNGEDIDAETGSPHLAAVAWHAFTLLEFAERYPEFDDRYKPEVRDADAA